MSRRKKHGVGLGPPRISHAPVAKRGSAGSGGGAARWAILAVLIETAKLGDIDPQAYGIAIWRDKP